MSCIKCKLNKPKALNLFLLDENMLLLFDGNDRRLVYLLVILSIILKAKFSENAGYLNIRRNHLQWASTHSIWVYLYLFIHATDKEWNLFFLQGVGVGREGEGRDRLIHKI